MKTPSISLPMRNEEPGIRPVHRERMDTRSLMPAITGFVENLTVPLLIRIQRERV
ncbi:MULTISPECIES: hypothetical protein [Pseudomonas]|jgi:hypothetical protein|uniref:hypothetical protein n=1 Tax=Pseudomonas TaxID=286 RepID=UPI000AB9283F|nr:MULTISPECIES: hypothetical protein [Pseudomonas]QIE32454.1 hypothetical protein G5J76_09375 [Pseudomonas psychrophila]WVI98997.1 hypothetical protein VR624_06420 [Pseudomonas psychrophila]